MIFLFVTPSINVVGLLPVVRIALGLCQERLGTINS